MIPQSTIDEVLQTAIIEDVIGEYVDLKKAGKDWRGLSPFTNEKTPSFYVVPAKNIFKDFSSGKGGSLVSFIMEMERLNFPEAIRLLAKRYNIEIQEEELSPDQQRARTERESLGALVAWAAKWFEDEMWEGKEGRAVGLAYFKGRQFREETLKKFGIGFCPDGWDGVMSKAAAEAGYSEDWLLASGLSRAREKDGVRDGLWDFFKGRVMFPIREVTGRTIAFGGRTLKTDKKVAKYFNSPESALYHKGDVLYGIDLAKPAITQSDRVFLVEGYTDVMSLHQAGIENVVASSGTALTSGQIKLIRRFTRNVTVLFDGDAAGIRASLRGIDLLLEEDINVQVVLFPDGEDPDSYATRVGSEELQAWLANESKDFVHFKIALLGQEAGDDPVKRAEMIHSVVESVAAIPDPIRRNVYLQSSAQQLGLSEAVLTAEIGRIQQKRVRDAQRSADRQRRAAELARKTGRSARGSSGQSGQASSPGPPPEFGAPLPDAPSEGGMGDMPEGPPDFGAPLPGEAGPPLTGFDSGQWPGEGAPDAFEVPSALFEPQAIRRILEEDLIRLLLNYGEKAVQVELDDEQATYAFADVVLHHIGKLGIKMEMPNCQKILEIYAGALESDKLPQESKFLQHADSDVQECVANALIVRHVVSENWVTMHQIYTVPESDLLEKAMLDSLHRLQLYSCHRQMKVVLTEMKTVEPDGAEMTALQRKKMDLDKENQALCKYFGTVVLPFLDD